MLFSPLTPKVFILLAFLQIVTFGGDWLARMCAVWLTPIPYDDQKLKSDYIRQAYKNTPYFYICWGGLCAMIFEVVTHFSSGNPVSNPINPNRRPCWRENEPKMAPLEAAGVADLPGTDRGEGLKVQSDLACRAR